MPDRNAQPSILKLLLLLSISFLPFRTLSQPKPDLSKYKTEDEKLKAWNSYCADFLGNDEYPENYPGLILASREGLQMASASQYGWRSVFSFYIGAGYEFTRVNDSAVYYLLISEAYGRQAHNTQRVINALEQLMHTYYHMGKVTERTAVIQQLQYISDTTASDKLKLEVSDVLASYHFQNSEYETALTYFLRNIELHKKQKNPTEEDLGELGTKLVAVGEIYKELGQFDKSLDYLREAQPYVVNYQSGKASLLTDLIAVFLKKDLTDSALHYYAQLVTTGSRDYDNTSDLAYANLNFSDYFFTKGNQEKAGEYSNIGYTLAQKSDNPACLMQARYMQGKLELYKKNWQKAISYLIPAVDAARGQDPVNERDIEQLLAQSYSGLGDWKNAYLHDSIHSALQDTIARETSKRNLAEMEARYQNNDKQQRIVLLDKDNKLKQLQIADSKKQRLLLLVGILLLLGLAGTLAIYYRNKRRTANLLALKNTQLDNANQTKARLFSIISHDLRTPVSQLFQFLQLQQIDPELLSREQRETHNKKISGGVGALLETMEDILVWSKTQMDRFEPSYTKVHLHTAMEEIFALLQPFSEAKNITIIHRAAPGLTARTDEHMLKVILRNLIQNAIQYAPQGTAVVVESMAGEGKTLVSVANEGGLPSGLAFLQEGTARPVNSSHKGLGLQLVQELCDRLSIKLYAKAGGTGGTVLFLEIPA